MLYQDMLSGDRPYFIGIGGVGQFENHKHPEIEISYCIEGSYEITVNNVRYVLEKGDMAIIGSMISHEFPGAADAQGLTIEVGPVLLAEYFEALTEVTVNNPILKINTEKHHEIYSLVNEIEGLMKTPTEFSELIIKGDLYKICAYILKNFEKMNASDKAVKMVRDMVNIEKAFEYVYRNYMNEITVEDVSVLCGYSKSNFCKIFKKITGDTFHRFLNNYRINMACNLLTGTVLSVEEIALKTGFPETKTFCRVFKEIKGMTSGEYRRN